MLPMQTSRHPVVTVPYMNVTPDPARTEWTAVQRATLVSVLAIVMGTLLFTSEVQHGTLANAVAAQPARWVTVAAKAVIGSGLGLLMGIAGMIAGFAALEDVTGRPRRVLGIDASATLEKTRDQVARIARSTAELIELGRDLRDHARADDRLGVRPGAVTAQLDLILRATTARSRGPDRGPTAWRARARRSCTPTAPSP